MASRNGRFGSGEAPERPADPAVRRDNLRRVFRLFKAYRWRLGVVLAAVLGGATVWGAVQWSRPAPSVEPSPAPECCPATCPMQQAAPPCQP